MAKTRLQIARSDIVRLFNQGDQRIFRRKDLSRLLSEHREFWRLRQDERVDSFIEFLSKNGKLKRARFGFPWRAETRYTWGDVPLYELIGSINPKAYFSHFTAMYFHELTSQVPKTIYLNAEQTPKPRYVSTLTQEQVDSSFRRDPRVTTNHTEYGGYRIFLLNGKQTEQLGIEDLVGPDNATVRVTSIERTLIDIVVRPNYAGGVFLVAEAFRLAEGRVSVNRIAAFLKKLDYVYPYRQAIGFLLDRCGVYNAAQIELLRNPTFDVDFYLSHGMKDTDYSEKWRLFFPKGL